jgi:hypothetical protein
MRVLVLDASRAACRGHPAEFVPPSEPPAPPAWLVELCGGCPIRAACLAWAVEHREVGYWGGTTTRQRHGANTAGSHAACED